MELYNHISLKADKQYSFLLYCDGRNAAGVFELTEETDDGNRFKGIDLPIVENTTVGMFGDGITIDYKFTEIYKNNFEIAANQYNIAVVELPELIYVDRKNNYKQLCKYIILEKTDKFTGTLNIKDLKPRFIPMFITKLKTKNVKVHFYKNYTFYPLTREHYLNSVD
jgi:hypothetical protein